MIFRDVIFMKIFVKLISRKNLLFLLFEMSLHLAHIVHHRSGNYLGGRLFLCLFWTQHIWRLTLLGNLFVPLKIFENIFQNNIYCCEEWYWMNEQYIISVESVSTNIIFLIGITLVHTVWSEGFLYKDAPPELKISPIMYFDITIQWCNPK